MATKLIPFCFENYAIRAININGEPWFVAQDVCVALEIQNVTQAIDKLDDDERSLFNIGLKDRGMFDNRVHEINIISESGMYTLVLRCRDAVNPGTIPHRFRKWVTNEVLPQIRKTGSYQHPQHKPEAPELFSHSDTRNLAQLIWRICNDFQFKQSWSNAVWFALRDVTGTPSPQSFEVRHIPLIAQECRRIYHITSQLQHITHEAEKQTIKRLLRKREDADTVLTEMKQLFSDCLCGQQDAVARQLEYWQENEINQFLHRH